MNEGDEAWIWLSGHNGELTKGTVVHRFRLPHIFGELFVIEIDTHIDPFWEVRQAGIGMFDRDITGDNRHSERAGDD